MKKIQCLFTHLPVPPIKSFTTLIETRMALNYYLTMLILESQGEKSQDNYSTNITTFLNMQTMTHAQIVVFGSTMK